MGSEDKKTGSLGKKKKSHHGKSVHKHSMDDAKPASPNRPLHKAEASHKHSSDKYKHYVNRDLSWLKFNERVLEEAEDVANPLFERLSFVSIYHSNLSEFLRVRVGSLYDQMLLNQNEVDSRSGMTTEEQLDAINSEIMRLTPRKNKALMDILSELEDHGIYYRGGNNFTKYELKYLESYFERNVLPLLSPHVIDKHHPFPFLQNDVVYIAVLLKTKNGNTRLGIIPASGYFERFLDLPSKYIKFTLIENLIYRFADLVFPKHKIIDKSIFSVTRNADIDADEAFFDHDLSYRDIMEILVKKRTRLEPIRLDMIANDSSEIKKRLMKHLGLKSDQVFYNEMPVSLSFIGGLKDVVRRAGHNELFYTPLRPQPTDHLDHSQPFIPQLLEKDVLLSYPYEDIRDFVKLLEEAADDPDVASIKITLYRVARNSRIVDALIRAAENGKEVTAVVELRARFDEENNIDWSKRLQEAGATLVYGIEHYKVHSKLMVMTLKKGNDVRFITQVGTGNYNEVTSRLYTDLSYMTSDHDIALNALDVFKNLSMGTLIEESKHLLVSPLTLKQTVLKLIDEEIEVAKSGQPASLQFKLNSLNDMDIIDKLIEASDAGVKIRMLIRGICCLVVEPEGKTRNIEISSIVGRYLEHSRIYIFGEGEREKVYIASADFMSRNTERRVEVGIPVTDPHSRQELKDIMNLMFSDNVKARYQVGNGIYRKRGRKPEEKAIDSQIAQYEQAYRNAGNKFPYDPEEKAETKEALELAPT